MAGKHRKPTFGVKKIGTTYRVVFSDSGNIVTGTPGYAHKHNADSHAEQMNKKTKG
jgi:hypothetical protein